MMCPYGSHSIDECDIRYCDNREALDMAVKALIETKEWDKFRIVSYNEGIMVLKEKKYYLHVWNNNSDYDKTIELIQGSSEYSFC